MNLTGCIGITRYWSETIFIISLKEKIVFVKLFEASFGSNIIASFTEFQVKVLIFFVLFVCKLLKFTFKVIFYINNAWYFIKKSRSSFLVISEINSSH